MTSIYQVGAFCITYPNQSNLNNALSTIMKYKMLNLNIHLIDLCAIMGRAMCSRNHPTDYSAVLEENWPLIEELDTSSVITEDPTLHITLDTSHNCPRYWSTSYY